MGHETTNTKCTKTQLILVYKYKRNTIEFHSPNISKENIDPHTTMAQYEEHETAARTVPRLGLSQSTIFDRSKSRDLVSLVKGSEIRTKL